MKLLCLLAYGLIIANVSLLSHMFMVWNPLWIFGMGVMIYWFVEVSQYLKESEEEL